MASATSRDSDKFMLRLPDGMRERIKRVAERNGRSMNAQIIKALEDHLSQTPSWIQTGPSIDPDTLGPEDFRDGEPPIPISPEVRAAMEQMIKEITDDVQRRWNDWLWLNESDKE